MVQEGETVIKGQPLIIPQTKGDEVRAIIRATVWLEGVAYTELVKQIPIKTGRSRSLWGLELSNLNLFPRFLEPDYQDYVVKSSKINLPEWRNFKFPVEVIKESYQEIDYLIEERDYEQALFLAQEKALGAIVSELDSGTVILEVKQEIMEDNEQNENLVGVRILFKTEMDIAQTNYSN